MSEQASNPHTDAMQELLGIIDTLLAPEGCPWDKEQTPLSMCDYLAEETFELIEGIRSNDPKESMEELGDVLFILLFLSTLFEREGLFTLSDSLKNTTAKMIRRHPHVFANTCFEDRETLLDNWETIKKDENKGTNKKHVFDSLPKGLPPLLKAYRINSKAARNGFTWQSDDEVEKQLNEEWQEWQNALKSGDKKSSEQEFGDYLLTLVEFGRRKGIKANSALDISNLKFLRRFQAMEELAESRGVDFSELDLMHMNALWEEVKTTE